MQSPPATLRYEWILPTLLAGLVATGVPLFAVPAGWLLLNWLPGRQALRACGLAGAWSLPGRVGLEVAFSLVLMPPLLNAIWHVTNDARWLLVVVWLYLTWGHMISVAVAPRSGGPALGPRRTFDRRSTAITVGAVLLLALFATVGPYWPSEVDGAPVPCLIHDFIKHHAVMFSLEQRPLPLGNPFFAKGADGPTYYYHFFYLAPATLRQWLPVVPIELAVGLASAAVAAGTLALFYLLAKQLGGGDGTALLALLLGSAIGALDPLVLLATGQKAIILDAWADHVVRIHPFLTQMVWSPQNVLGITVTLVAVLLLNERLWWPGWLVLGPWLGACLIGSSIWVAFAVFPALGLMLLTLLRPRPEEPGGRASVDKRLMGAALTAILMLAAAAPTLRGYLTMSGRHEAGLTLSWPHSANAWIGRAAPPGFIANLLDAWWMLPIELGPLLLFPLILVPRETWSRVWQLPGLRLLTIGAGAGLVSYLTIRSDFTYNDFGQKVMLVPMALGVLLGGCAVCADRGRFEWLNPFGWCLRRGGRGVVRVLQAALVLFVCLLGSLQGLYQAPLTVLRRWIGPDGGWSHVAHADALRARREAGAGRYVRYELPRDAVLQADPGSERLLLAQIARVQLGVTVLERDTMVFQPREIEKHDACLSRVSRMLELEPSASATAHALRLCGITHVYVGEIERERWRVRRKLSDPEYFEIVYADEAVTIHRVLTAPDRVTPRVPTTQP